LISRVKLGALWFLSIGVVFIPVIVGATRVEGIIRTRVPFSAHMPPMRMAISIPVSNSTENIKTTIGHPYRSNDVIGERSDKLCIAGLGELSGEKQDWCWRSTYLVGWMSGEGATEWANFILVKDVNRRTTAPILIDHTVGNSAVLGDFINDLDMIKPNPRAFLKFECAGGDIGLLLGSARKINCCSCLLQSSIGNILSTIGLPFHLNNKLLCLIRLLTSCGSKIGSLRSLSDRLHGQSMSIRRTRSDFVPLETYKYAGKHVDSDNHNCPPKGRPFIAAQLFLYFLEFIGGVWLCCVWGLTGSELCTSGSLSEGLSG
jgi:hypothetical protein